MIKLTEARVLVRLFPMVLLLPHRLEHPSRPELMSPRNTSREAKYRSREKMKSLGRIVKSNISMDGLVVFIALGNKGRTSCTLSLPDIFWSQAPLNIPLKHNLTIYFSRKPHRTKSKQWAQSWYNYWKHDMFVHIGGKEERRDPYTICRQENRHHEFQWLKLLLFSRQEMIWV